jgi:hypothetical protein
MADSVARNRKSPDQLDKSWVNVGKDGADSASQSIAATDDNDAQTNQSSKSILDMDEETRRKIVDLLKHSAIGACFGFFLQKGRPFEPRVIQDQFTFTDNTMMQMFLMGAATSQIVYGVLSSLPEDNPARQHFMAIKEKYVTSRGKRGLKAIAIGSALLGAGMSLAGSCPGTVYAQLGSKVLGSGYVFLGSLLGYVLFARLEATYLKPYVYGQWVPSAHQLEDYLPSDWKENPGKLYFTFAAALVGAAAMFHNFTPETNPYGTSSFSTLASKLFPENSIGDLFALPWRLVTAPSWPAMMCGVGIGLLQLPNIFLFDTFLGSSSAVGGLVSPLAPYLVRLGVLPKSAVDETCELQSWTSGSTAKVLSAMTYVGSMVAGARLSAWLGGTMGAASGFLSTTGAVPRLLVPTLGGRMAQAVVGGAMVLFGSRISSGCTSGNGISGMSLQTLNGLVAVPAMFGSAIIVQHLMRWIVGA